MYGCVDCGQSGGCHAKFDANTPTCTACDTFILPEVRALQCNCCEKREQWKCIECLGISAEVYNALIENKEI